MPRLRGPLLTGCAGPLTRCRPRRRRNARGVSLAPLRVALLFLLLPRCPRRPGRADRPRQRPDRRRTRRRRLHRVPRRQGPARRPRHRQRGQSRLPAVLRRLPRPERRRRRGRGTRRRPRQPELGAATEDRRELLAPTPRACGTTSAAPCPTSRRARSARTRSTPSSPTCCTWEASLARTRCWTRRPLPKVEMPNRDGFVPDDRPDTD